LPAAFACGLTGCLSDVFVSFEPALFLGGVAWSGHRAYVNVSPATMGYFEEKQI